MVILTRVLLILVVILKIVSFVLEINLRRLIEEEETLEAEYARRHKTEHPRTKNSKNKMDRVSGRRGSMSWTKRG